MFPQKALFRSAVCNIATAVRLSVPVLAVLATTPFFAQQPVSLAGIPHDWSHRHLIFSRPDSLLQAVHLQQEPRYWHQWFHRNSYWNSGGPARSPILEAEVAAAEDTAFPPISILQPVKRAKGGLWGESLGTSATVGAGMLPAKFSFNSNTLNCATAAQPDYVVFNTSQPGAAGQATIVAYDNLYSGTCPTTGGHTVPQVYWAYNTGTGATISTSVSISLDGTQLGFVQSAGGKASLVILKFRSADGGAPAAPVAWRVKL